MALSVAVGVVASRVTLLPTLALSIWRAATDHDAPVFRCQPFACADALGISLPRASASAPRRDRRKGNGTSASAHQTIELHARHDDLDCRIGAQQLHALPALAMPNVQRGSRSGRTARVGELHMPRPPRMRVVAQAVKGLRHDPPASRERRKAERHNAAGEQAAPMVAAAMFAPGDGQAVPLPPPAQWRHRAQRDDARGAAPPRASRGSRARKATPRSLLVAA